MAAAHLVTADADITHRAKAALWPERLSRFVRVLGGGRGEGRGASVVAREGGCWVWGRGLGGVQRGSGPVGGSWD